MSQSKNEEELLRAAAVVCGYHDKSEQKQFAEGLHERASQKIIRCPRTRPSPINPHVQQQCVLTAGSQDTHGWPQLDHLYPGAEGLPNLVVSRVYRDQIEFLADAAEEELEAGWVEYYARHRIFYFGLPSEVLLGCQSRLLLPSNKRRKKLQYRSASHRENQRYLARAILALNSAILPEALVDRLELIARGPF